MQNETSIGIIHTMSWLTKFFYKRH